MKTLFLCNSYLLDNNGGVYASKAYINAFAMLSESMTLVYSKHDSGEVQDILDKNILKISLPDNRSKAKKFIDLCFGTVNRFQNHILKYINPQEYDTVVFNGSNVSSGLIKKFKKMGLNIITIHHNYEMEYLRGDCDPLILLPSLIWTYIYEGQAVRYSDINLTLTEDDIYLLNKNYGGNNFATIGVFEYVLAYPKEQVERVRGHKFVITGWLGSKQTEDSLVPWIHEYYPLLKEIDTNSQLTIAGRDPSSSLCEIAKKNGIAIIASPKDMQPILNSADYYICPTDRGGGLKLRNLDGLKSGLPVLTHKVSARGYEYMINRNMVFSYYNKESFTDGVKALLSCKKTKSDIIKEYNQYYSLINGTLRLRNILEQHHIQTKSDFL